MSRFADPSTLGIEGGCYASAAASAPRHRVGSTTTEPNFGYIDIDWTEADPAIRIELRSVANRSLLRQTVQLSELRAK